MASSISIGSISVPVIAHVTRTGDVGSGNIVSQVMAALGYTTGQYYDAGTYVGYMEADSPSAGGTGDHSQSVYITGGRTGLHDDSELIVTNPTDSGSGQFGPGKAITATLSHIEGQTAVEIASFGSLKVASAINQGARNTYTEERTAMGAISVSWEDASTDPTKVNAYIIYTATEKRVLNKASGNITTTYTLDGSWYINIPWYNKQNDLFMSFDEIPEPTPEDPFDPSDQDPYNPHPDDTSDTIDIPTDPLIGVSNAGWVHVYNPSTNGLQNFGAWLFPNPELPSTADPTEIVNYLLLLCQTLANSRLIDYVLDCHIIPASPTVSGAQDIKVGGRTAVGISAPVVASDYISVSCGSLNIQEYFGGFQDFLLTKSHLYLPFVGFVDVLPEYWQSGTISVDYKFNVIDGSFMVYIRSASSKSQLNGSVIAQYSGNACMHVPITGVNYSNMVSGIVGAAVAASGAQTAAGVLGQAYSAANTMISGGQMVQSNGYNSTAAILGVRYPYLVIERPVPSYAGNYSHDKGFPSNISTLLSNVSGYTVIDDIDLSGIPLMEVELNELRNLLKEGVYF